MTYKPAGFMTNSGLLMTVVHESPKTRLDRKCQEAANRDDIESLKDDRQYLASLCAALAADLPDRGDYCNMDSEVYASMPQHLCDMVDAAEKVLESILKQ